MLVLNGHRHDIPPLATVDFQRDRLVVRFSKPATREQFFSIFGNVGFLITEVVDDKIKGAEIIEFSLSP